MNYLGLFGCRCDLLGMAERQARDMATRATDEYIGPSPAEAGRPTRLRLGSGIVCEFDRLKENALA